MISDRDKIAGKLKKYIPPDSIDYIIDLLFDQPVHFKVSKPRKTKHGDFRPGRKGEPHRITVNGDLNPYAFLITTVHEFAHLVTHEKHGSRVKAHGNEWKNEFRKLLIPLLDLGLLPEDIQEALKNSLYRLKASTCTDKNLYRTLKKYDKPKHNSVLLEDLQHEDQFRLGKRIFKRGPLRRTRYLCQDVRTNKLYLVSGLAEVERYEDE